uniref:Retrovirus-related env polyprotein from transposon gypsy n=1 Tax=Aedes albopictus TaxID=7160 RepID=A0A1W7R678_AEDAL
MLATLVGIIVLASTMMCQELSIRNLHQDSILMQQLGPCKIQIGNIRIIHPINLTDLELTINQLTNLVYNRNNNNNVLTEISKHKIRELYTNLLQIKPRTHYRRKRWDVIGTTWKWIAGSPDAQDLRIINGTLNELINENNNQYKVNEQISQRIGELTKVINQIVERTQSNQILLNDIDIITTILNIDIINRILTGIQEAILFSKAHITNSKVLSMKEINIIKTMLNNQGVQVDLPDEALNFVTPKIATSKDTLLYIIHVPQLETDESMIIRIFPLTINNSIIEDYPTFVIKHGKQLWTTSKPEDYVQLSTFIRKYEDLCILPLIRGTTTHCNTKVDNETTMQLITNNKLLITNAHNNELSSDCGPDNRKLSGNFIVSFSNCTINFMQKKFTSTEIIDESDTIQGALHNLIVNNHPSFKNDIATINNITLLNRNQLAKVFLQQQSIDIWKWSLLGGMSLSTTLVVIAFIIITFHLRESIHRIARKITKRRKPKAVPRRKDNEPSVEDATSLPPGRVTA